MYARVQDEDGRIEVNQLGRIFQVKRKGHIISGYKELLCEEFKVRKKK